MSLTFISLDQGRDDSVDVAAVDSAGVAINLTGATLYYTAKRNINDTDANAVIAKSTGSGITHTNPTLGLARIDFVPADTAALAGNYHSELALKDSAAKKYTLWAGTLLVVGVVKQTIT